MRELLEKLCALRGVSSREDEVRTLVRAEAEPWADELLVDPLGSLIVRKRGCKPGKAPLMLTAYLDECGVMVSDHTEDGFLRFQTVGSVDRRSIIGKPVLLGEKRIPGVIGMKPVHLSTKEERKRVPKTENLYIDIGAKNRDEAQKLAELGEVGTFAVSAGPFGNGFWKGRGLDSRIPCAVLLSLLREEWEESCTFVFAAHGQLGGRGLYGPALRERPKAALCLHGAAAEDFWYIPEGQRCCCLGGGVVLPVSDRGTMYDRGLFEELRALAVAQSIPWQLQAHGTGNAGSGAVQRRGIGIPTAGLALLVRNLHAPTELCALSDAEAMGTLCRAWLTNAGKERS